jgi:hypothetical protein
MQWFSSIFFITCFCAWCSHMMMHKDQTHIKRNCFSIGIISSNLQSGCYTRCCHVAYRPWHKPVGGAWCKVSGPRCLCIYCGEDAPHVYPADRRCALSAFNVSCPLRWQAAPRPSYRRRACPVHYQTVCPCCEVHYFHHHLYVTREASPARRYCADLGC